MIIILHYPNSILYFDLKSPPMITLVMCLKLSADPSVAFSFGTVGMQFYAVAHLNIWNITNAGHYSVLSIEYSFTFL